MEETYTQLQLLHLAKYQSAKTYRDLLKLKAEHFQGFLWSPEAIVNNNPMEAPVYYIKDILDLLHDGFLVESYVPSVPPQETNMVAVLGNDGPQHESLRGYIPNITATGLANFMALHGYVTSINQHRVYDENGLRPDVGKFRLTETREDILRKSGSFDCPPEKNLAAYNRVLSQSLSFFMNESLDYIQIVDTKYRLSLLPTLLKFLRESRKKCPKVWEIFSASCA
jgi:hypothetical protein